MMAVTNLQTILRKRIVVRYLEYAQDQVTRLQAFATPSVHPTGNTLKVQTSSIIFFNKTIQSFPLSTTLTLCQRNFPFFLKSKSLHLKVKPHLNFSPRH